MKISNHILTWRWNTYKEKFLAGELQFTKFQKRLLKQLRLWWDLNPRLPDSWWVPLPTEQYEAAYFNWFFVPVKESNLIKIKKVMSIWIYQILMKICLNGSYASSHQTLWSFFVFIFHVVSKLMTSMENQLSSQSITCVVFTPSNYFTWDYIYVSFGYTNKRLNGYKRTCVLFCLKQFQNIFLPIIC